MGKVLTILPCFLFLFVSCATQISNKQTALVDSDLDGIPDARDLCPNESGSLFNFGCPADEVLSLDFNKNLSEDSDLDGVPDTKDNCPNLYGSPFNQGCPFED